MKVLRDFLRGRMQLLLSAVTAASALPRECTAIWDNIHYDAERVSYYTYDHPDPVGVMTFQAFLDDDLQEARNMGCPGA